MGGFNPWIGFKTYEESDEKIYKGRTDDVERLYSLMTVNGCVVLYANSGIGKSSLINAGILPKLKRESEFVPVKVLFKSDMFERQPENGKAARKSESDDKDFLPDFDKWLVEAIESANFDYLISDLPDEFRNAAKVEICETLEMTEDLKEKSRKNAWWYLHTHALKLIGFGMEHEFRFMLIFDQFEEIFHMTKSTRQVNAFFSFFQSLMQPQMPKDFMEALAETQCPCPEWNDKALPYNVLVSMRKDSIGELDYWCRQKLYIPSLQAIRFSLQPLDDRQCREIICGQEGIDVFSNAMADKIISAAKDENDEVSSILLSVLCQKLYRNFLEKNEVDEKLCDTPNILLREAYYEQLHGLPITRRQLKTIESSLVNDKGQRTRILLENFDSNTVKVLRELDKRFLVHITETGRNEKKVEYVEMVHDKIAEMVKGERDKTKKVKRFGGLLALLFLGVFINLSVVVKQNQIENPKMRTIEKYRDKKHDWELSINDTIGNGVLLFDMPKEINTLRLRGGTLKEKSVNISNIDTIIFDGEVTLEDGCFCGRNNVKVLKFGEYANITVKQPLVFEKLVREPFIDPLNSNLKWHRGCLYQGGRWRRYYDLILKTSDEENVYDGAVIEGCSIGKKIAKIDVDDNDKVPQYYYILTGNAANLSKGRFTSNRGILLEIDLPKLKTVENQYFSGFSNLESVVLPSVQHIGDSAFYSCTKLDCVVLPSVQFIGKKAFYGCAKLDSVVLPSVQFIGDKAFGDCYNLKSIDLPKVEEIGPYAFYRCSLKYAFFPNVTRIDSTAFTLCSPLESVNIPNCEIEPKDLQLPKSVTSFISKKGYFKKTEFGFEKVTDEIEKKKMDKYSDASYMNDANTLRITKARYDRLRVEKDVLYIVRDFHKGDSILRIKQLKVSIRNNCYFKWKGSLYTDRYVNVPLALVLPAGDQMRIWTSYCTFKDDGHDYYIMDGSFPNPDDLPKSVYVPYGEGRKYQLYYGNDDIKELGFFKTLWYDFTLYVKCVTNYSAINTNFFDIPWFVYVLLLALLVCFGMFISVHKKMNPIGSVIFVMVLFVVMVVFFYLVNYWSNDYSFTRCTMNCKTNSIIMLSMALVMGILLLVWLSKLFSYIGYEKKVSRKKMVRQVKIVYYGRLILGLYLVIIGLWLLTDPGFNEFLVGGILGIGVWLMGTDYVYERQGNEYEEIYRTEMVDSGKSRKARLIAYYVLAVAGLVSFVAYLIIEILEGQFAIWLFLLQIVACIAVTVYSIWKIRKLRKISNAEKAADTDATDEETV